MLNIFFNYYIFWITSCLLFKMFISPFSFWFVSIFKIFNLFFIYFNFGKTISLNFYFIKTFFVYFAKLYFVNVFFIFIQFFLFFLQFSWFIIFSIACFSLVIFFLPYYVTSGFFIFNYLFLYDNSTDIWGRNKYVTESVAAPFVIYRNRDSYFNLFFEFHPEYTKKLEIFSGYAIMNPDNYFRTIYYVVTIIFFFSFIFAICFFVFLTLFSVPIAASFLFTKLVFVSFSNYLFSFFIIIGFFISNFIYFFIKFFSLFIIFIILIGSFYSFEFDYKLLYKTNTIKNYIFQQEFFVNFFFNIKKFFTFYYNWLILTIVEFFEFCEFIAYEDFEYIFFFRFYPESFYPTILDWLIVFLILNKP